MRRVIGSVLLAVLLGAFTEAVAQLPPEIMADRYLVEAEQLIAKQDYKQALELMNKIIALQEEHKFAVPDVFHFKYAQVALSAGSYQAAIDAVNRYLAAAGREGQFYREALEILVQAEQEEARRRQEEARRRQEEARRRQEEARRRQEEARRRQEEARRRREEEERRRQPIEPKMVVISGGSFRMGCVSAKDCNEDEKPVHEVRVESFELSRYEVTFEEYDRFVAATGRRAPVDVLRRSRPVIEVSWDDALAYTEWLSEKTGTRYRLPTEAEWEYAARAGSTTKYSWGNDIGYKQANCDGCEGVEYIVGLTPVGWFSPNSWGVYDMHGNVWEWVQDCWNDSYQGAPTDGSAWETGDCERRVLRGGSCSEPPVSLRSANRFRVSAGVRGFYYGFRVARTLLP